MVSLLPGSSLGRYQLVEQIGRGGMASVFRAHDSQLNRFVAIKVLPSFQAEDPSFVERFRREAQAVASLSHQSIIQVHDFGEDKGFSYIVMELVTGGTLQDRMGEKMTLSDVMSYVVPLASALDYAHGQGVIHRDIKPSNVLLDADDRPILSDFGLARMMEGSVGLTRGDSVIGTPEYMSPEQALGRPADKRSDLYALGIIVYQMLLGQTPFKSDTPSTTLMAQIHSPVPLPSAADPDVDPMLETTLIKALAKDPDDRHQSSVELVQALSAISGTESVEEATSDPAPPEVPMVGPETVATPPPGPATAPAPRQSPEPSDAPPLPAPSGRWRMPALGIAVVVAVVAIGLLASGVLSSDPPEDTGQPSSPAALPPAAPPVSAQASTPTPPAPPSPTARPQAAVVQPTGTPMPPASPVPTPLPAATPASSETPTPSPIPSGRPPPQQVVSSIQRVPATPAGHITYAHDGRVYQVEARENAEPVDISAALEASDGTEDLFLNASPDGKWLLVETDRFDPDCEGWPCLVLFAEGSTTVEVPKINPGSWDVIHPDDGISALSGDASLIVYSDQAEPPKTTDLFLVRKMDEGWEVRLNLTNRSPFLRNINPDLAPDESSMVFQCGDTGWELHSICEVRIDGSGFRVVVSPDSRPSDFPADVTLHNPSYAPDGSIVFAGNWETDRIWRLPADGSELLPIRDDHWWPCVLPDGRIAAVFEDWSVSDTTPDYRIDVISPGGSGLFTATVLKEVTDFSDAIGCSN